MSIHGFRQGQIAGREELYLTNYMERGGYKKAGYQFLPFYLPQT